MIRLAPLALALALSACQVESAPADVASADIPAPAPEAEVIPAAVDLPADAPVATVYKSPTCGCCTLWAEYMAREGFRVETEDVPDVRVVSAELGMPADLGSCHVATVATADGEAEYIVEGHVPADAVRRLLTEQPDARGLTVPGMPIGSPGMEQGDRRQAYNVLLVDNAGEAAIYERIPGNEG
ncbi:MAG: DUF411 domain-containing protein [Bacteroidota bacterium]